MTFHLHATAICVALAMLTACAGAEPSKPGERKRAPIAQPNDYYVPFVTGSDGRQRSVMDIPGSVTVRPRKVIDDQQATTVGDVLRNSPGVTVGGR